MSLESEAGEILDAQGGAVLPGLINTHTHAAMTLFRGLADDLPLSDWLNHHVFPAEKNSMPIGSIGELHWPAPK